MKLLVGTRRTDATRRHFAVSGIVVVIAVGVAGSALAATSAMISQRELMLARAQTAANAFSAEEIHSLQGALADRQNPTYQNIKRRLTRIRQDNADTRFSYLLGTRNGRVFFYVDSEQPGSTDYSPPGQLYPDATPSVIAAFHEDKPFIEGPLRDSYGTWFSAIAPVIDQRSQKPVALLGIDMPATTYYSQIALRALIPLLLAAIPLLVLIRNRRLELKEREITDLKSQFVTIASHELRSPLSGTMWGVQSLLKPSSKEPLTAHQKHILTSVYNNTASSIATVNEILDFSIFERGKHQADRHVMVNIIDVLRDVEKIFALSAQEAGVKIVYVGNWPKRIPVRGDPNGLKRAFSNIISNAIKYSPEGGRIELAHHIQKTMHIIGIRDHGIGIPASEQQQVLKGYYRAANATKVKTHGTGMGLWVTKMTIEQHRGKLRIDSAVGKGTTVFLYLPTVR